MAFPIEDLCTRLATVDEVIIKEGVAILKKNSLLQVIDVACLDDDDIFLMMGNNSTLVDMCRKLRDLLGKRNFL